MSEFYTGDYMHDSAFHTLYVFDNLCIGLQGLEIFVGIQAKDFKTWIQDVYNKLELSLLSTALLGFCLSSLGWKVFALRSFRLLRLFKLLSRFEVLSYVKHIVTTLEVALFQLLTVCSILFFFMLTFSLLGMSAYQNSFKRRCVSMEYLSQPCQSYSAPWSSACSLPLEWERDPLRSSWNVSVQGGYPYFELCDIVSSSREDFPMDYLGRRHTCELARFRRGEQVEQMCAIVGYPSNQYGYAQFDNVGSALLAVLQWVIADSAYDIMWFTYESEYDARFLTFLLYPAITITCSWMLLGMFIAIVTGTFQRVREEQAVRKGQVVPEVQHVNQANAPLEGSGHLQNNLPTARDASQMILTIQSTKMQLPIAEHRLDIEQDSCLSSWGWNRCKDGFFKVQQSSYYQFFLASVVTVQTVFLATDDETSLSKMSSTLVLIYSFSQAFYSLDVFLQVLVMSRRRLESDTAFVEFFSEALLSLLGIIGLAANVNFFIRIQCIRIFRLYRYIPVLQGLLNSAVKGIPAVINLCIFCIIWILCFEVTGRFLFHDSMNSLTRSNFSSFEIGFLTVFQIFTGDSWSSVLYSAMESKDGFAGKFAAAIFFIVLLLMSNIVLVNLFISVVIENFNFAETTSSIKDGKNLMWMRKQFANYQSNLQESLKSTQHPVSASNLRQTDTKESFLLTSFFAKANLAATARKPSETMSKRGSEASGVEVEVSGLKPGLSTRLLINMASLANPNVTLKDQKHSERVLFVFSSEQTIRKAFIRIGNSFVFDSIVYLTIVVSCVLLCLTPPYDDIPEETPLVAPAMMSALNLVTTLIFTVEFLVRVMVSGLILEKDAYLRSGWNLVDFLVLLLSWMDDLASMSSISSSKSLRIMRILRPLRLVKKNKGMRTITNALLSALVPTFYVLVFLVTILLSFGVIGKGLFGHLFYSCSAYDVSYPAEKAECSGTILSKDQLYLSPRAWVNYQHNFDSIGSAMITLFKVTTLKYIGTIQASMDVTARDTSPSTNNSTYYGLFYEIYVLVGSFFIWNLFVGFVVDGFYANRGADKLESTFRRYHRLISQRKSNVVFTLPREPWRVSIYELLRSKRYKSFSIACITINVVFMSMQHADSSSSFNRMISTQNLFFYVQLLVEVVLSFLGLGFRHFFQDVFRIFDLIITLALSVGYASGSREFMEFAKSFRLLRIIQVMCVLGPVDQILQTLLKSLPQLASISALIFLILVMFASLGVQLFGITRAGRRLGPTANFESFPRALMTCLQILRGDEWQELLEDSKVQSPSCTPRFDSAHVYGYEGEQLSFGDCGAPAWLSDLFFIGFKLVCEASLLNLIIGMILQNFSYITEDASHVEDAEWSAGPSLRQVEELHEIFLKYSDAAEMFHPEDTLILMKAFPPPLGFRSSGEETKIGRLDRAAARLVRAELNLLLRERRGRTEFRNSSTIPISRVALLLSKARTWFEGRDDCTQVTFEDVVTVMLFWRLPALIPDSLKRVHSRRVQEIQFLHHALAIKDFLRRQVARKKELLFRSPSL